MLLLPQLEIELRSIYSIIVTALCRSPKEKNFAFKTLHFCWRDKINKTSKAGLS